MRAKPFWYEIRTNILYAQAFGCWLYIHIGTWALLAGLKCPFGLRIEFNEHRKSIRFVRHDMSRVVD